MLFIEIFGYVGSALVAISLMMSNIVRLRWINLVGAGIFSTYGFIIQAWPVAALNGAIVLIDIYHLWRIAQQPASLNETKTTQLSVSNPYVVDVLSAKWPELTGLASNQEVRVTLKGSQPTQFEVLT